MASEDSNPEKVLADEEEQANAIKQRESKLLEEVQNQIKGVDKDMVALAESVDLHHNKVVEISQVVEKQMTNPKYDNEKEFKDFVTTTHENISQLVNYVKNVKNMQTDVLQSLSKLLHLIHVDSGEICTNKLPDKCKLQIDSYILHDKSTSEVVDVWIEMLQDENKRLRERNKLYREHAALVNEREKLVCKDRDRLRKELDKLLQDDSHKNTDFEMVDLYYADRSMNDEDSDKRRLEAKRNLEAKSETKNVGVDAILTPLHKTSDSTDGKDMDILELKQSLDKAQKRIDELEASVQATRQVLAEKERLLKSVCIQEVFKVEVMYTRDVRAGYIEEKLVGSLKKSNVRCNVVKDASKIIENKRNVVIFFCYGYSTSSWDEVMAEVKLLFPENKKVAMVMLYTCASRYDGRKLYKEAEKKHSKLLSKSATFPIEFAYRSPYFLNGKDDYKPLVEFIHSQVTPEEEVVGCPVCADYFLKKM